MGMQDARWMWVPVAATLATTSSQAQTVLVTPPPEPATAGAPAVATAYFLNDGDAPLRIAPPDELIGQARWGGGTSEVILTRAAEFTPREVPPGGFTRVAYRFTVPPAARGQITLTAPGSPPAVLAVAPATGEPLDSPGVATMPTDPAPPALTSTPSAPLRSAARRAEIADYVAEHFAAYEPMYFLAGSEDPNVKFQVSLKYRIFNQHAPLVRALPALGGLHFGYSQTSFWDLESASSPFFDNSYRPELMVSYADLLRDRGAGRLRQLGLQAGVQHESNGQDGPDSRSMNYLYVRPTFTFGAATHDDARAGDLFLSVSPRLHAYVGDDEDNPDIEEFRGYGDLRVVLGQREGLQLAATGRIGSDFDKGSLQLDLTYPLRPLLRDNVDVFLHGQFFTGYGESLLLYDESDTTFRIGVSLIR